MPKFLIKKWQAGEDAWGDYFSEAGEKYIIEAPTEEVCRRFVTLMHGAIIYAGEALNLQFIGPCNEDSAGKPCTMLDIFTWYGWGTEGLLREPAFTELYKYKDSLAEQMFAEGKYSNEVLSRAGIRFVLERVAPDLIPHVFANV